MRLLKEERGVQVEAEEEEKVAYEERKEGERSELTRLRLSLIEAKVVSVYIHVLCRRPEPQPFFRWPLRKGSLQLRR